MKFIGVDLGWQSQPSGLCCLEWTGDRLELRSLARLETLDQVLTWIDHQVADGPAGVAVDAPTLIPNATGMRWADRLTHRYFGKYHAGAYPANLGHSFAARTVGFGLSLEARGFDHDPEGKRPDRFQIEVFPHPAMVYLFSLDRILKYKKGRLAERQQALQQLRQLILQHLPEQEPMLCLEASDLPEVPSRGAALKALEDQLDALICAYIAAHWWYWGPQRNLVLGDRAQGYIVVPGLWPVPS